MHRMQTGRLRENGYALLMMVIALLGVGGIVLTGFTQSVKQQADHERSLHNQRVLLEAKQGQVSASRAHEHSRSLYGD